MTYRILEKIGAGGYGSVYKGFDDSLNRDIAIKFIQSNAGDAEFAKQQAVALSRCICENVVTVFALEDLEDPAVKVMKPALVMEFVSGETVRSQVSRGSLTFEEVRRIGLGAINGLVAIHGAGIVHGDLSLENVLVTPTSVKIIDILYKGTLAGGTPEIRDLRRQDDRNDLRVLLMKLIRSVSVDQADLFTKRLTPQSEIDDIRNEFLATTDPKLIIDVPKRVEELLSRINESSFVSSQEYASALSESTPDQVVVPLLEAIISNGGIARERDQVVNLLWDRLDFNGKRLIGTKLSEAIDREVPTGKWASYVLMLFAFGRTGWASLSRVTRLRFENALINDMRNGSFDYYRSRLMQGVLGTWVKNFYAYIDNRQNEILNIVVGHLHGSWNRQNYIGEYFSSFLPRLITTTEDRERLIKALAAALKDNAFCVKSQLGTLPPELQADVTAAVEQSTPPFRSDAE